VLGITKLREFALVFLHVFQLHYWRLAVTASRPPPLEQSSTKSSWHLPTSLNAVYFLVLLYIPSKLPCLCKFSELDPC
jgi:hypothetical protein